MSKNQRSSSFLAIRFFMTALIAVVFIAGSTIGTGASIAPSGDKKGDGERSKGVKSEAPTAALTPGNLAVVQIGDGSGTLTTAAAPLSIVEYTPAGALVQTIPISSVTSPRATVTGTSTSEGHIVRSTDGNFLTLTGYDIAAGTAAGFIVAGTPRTIARVGASGVVDLTTAFNDGSTGSVRAAVTTDGTNIWQTNSVGGVRYGTFGSVAASTQMSSTPTNVRVAKIFNGQLYVTSASGTFLGISSIGTGTPTTTGQTTTPLTGMPTTGTHSPYSFSINPAGTVLYLADDGSAANTGGIQKWTFAAGAWTLAYTLLNNGTTTTATRGLTVNWSGANPIIYATTTSTIPASNTLIAVTDTGAASTATILATSPTNTIFRGVDFTPGVSTAAGVFVSGRVITSEGRGITNAAVTISGNSLPEPRTVITGRRGTYMFDDLEPGATYIVTVRSRRFTFSNPSQVISIVDNVSDADFIADGGTSRSR